MPRKAAHVSGHKSASVVTLYHGVASCFAYIGAGTSAESGIPTFRGAGGLWRQYEATDLGTINTRRLRLLSRISRNF